MILVVGSTGMLGAEIVRQLRQQDKPVQALVRSTSDPAKVNRLRDLGAALVEGDLTDAASLAPVCQGIKTVITTATAMASRSAADTLQTVDEAGHLNLVDAAVKADVPHMIFVSTRCVLKTDSPLTITRRNVEQRLMESRLDYTILRTSYFMETWLSPLVGFDYAEGRVTIYGDGKNPISWISYGDVARFAVMSVDSPAARNTILDLGGPDKLTPNEVVGIFQEHVGRPFDVTCVPVEALQAQRAGTDDPLQQSFSALMIDYASGDPVDMEATLRRFPLSLTSVQDYVAHVLEPTAE